MFKKIIFLFLLLGLFLFICIKPVFAYTSIELRNYAGHECIVRILNPATPIPPYLSFRGQVMDIYYNSSGQCFIILICGKNQNFYIPIEAIVNIRYANTTEV